MSPLKRSIAAALAALLVLAGIAGASGAFSDLFKDDKPAAEKAPGPDEPDLRKVPKVVATVNGEDISKREFTETYKNQFDQASMQSSGQGVDQKQLRKDTVKGLVDQELLVQEAERRKIKVTDQQVTGKIRQFAKESGAKSSKEYLASLKQQGIDEKEARSQIAIQIQIEDLLAEEGGDKKPTTKQLKKLYKASKQQQKAAAAQAPEGSGQPELPSFKEMRPQLEQQWTSERESKIVQKLVKSLRSGADITINLK